MARGMVDESFEASSLAVRQIQKRSIFFRSCEREIDMLDDEESEQPVFIDGNEQLRRPDRSAPAKEIDKASTDASYGTVSFTPQTEQPARFVCLSDKSKPASVVDLLENFWK